MSDIVSNEFEPFIQGLFFSVALNALKQYSRDYSIKLYINVVSNELRYITQGLFFSVVLNVSKQCSQPTFISNIVPNGFEYPIHGLFFACFKEYSEHY